MIGTVGLVKKPIPEHILTLAACVGSPSRESGVLPFLHLLTGRLFFLSANHPIAMNPKALDAVWKCQCENAIQKLVLICLAHHSKDDGVGARPSRLMIARKCNLSVRSVTRALRQLEEAGWVSIRRTGTPNRKMANSYVIHLNPRRKTPPAIDGRHAVTRNRGLIVTRNGCPIDPPTGDPQSPNGCPIVTPTGIEQARERGRERTPLTNAIPSEAEWMEICRMQGLPDWKATDEFLRQGSMVPPWGKVSGNLQYHAARLRTWWQADGCPKEMPSRNGRPPVRQEKEIPMWNEIYGKNPTPKDRQTKA